AHLEMLARFLVVVRRTLHAEAVDLGRQRHGTAHERSRALGGVDDALGGLIEHPMVVRFQPYPNFLFGHFSFSLFYFQGSRLDSSCYVSSRGLRRERPSTSLRAGGHNFPQQEAR